MDDVLYSTTIAAVSNLNQNLSQTSDEIRATVADARKIVDDIKRRQGHRRPVGERRVALHRNHQLDGEPERNPPEINQGQGSVGKLINDDSLLKNAKLTLQKLDQATEGLEDQGPLSVLGMAAGKLF